MHVLESNELHPYYPWIRTAEPMRALPHDGSSLAVAQVSKQLMQAATTTVRTRSLLCDWGRGGQAFGQHGLGMH